jgi:hypothetical protein
MLNSKQKTIEITNRIQHYVKSLLYKQTTDLKLICKHASLLNGKGIYNPNNVINKNSNFINNSSKSKQIIYATIEKLNEDKDIHKYFNKSSQTFDYYSLYEEEFQNMNDNNRLLNILFSDSHPELNKISYYSLTKKEVTQNLSIKFIVSILKTIYIRRYITKRKNNDYIRFLILNKEEMYIYPPEAYNNTFLHFLYNAYHSQIPQNKSMDDLSQLFPYDSYNFFNNFIYKDDN